VAFAFLSRKFDAMLFWLGLFAIFYGQRVWLDLRLLALMIPPSIFFDSLRAAVKYLVPIPAFFYFDAAGFLTRFGGRKAAIAISIPFLCLFVATLLFGHKHTFDLINNGIVNCLRPPGGRSAMIVPTATTSVSVKRRLFFRNYD
jgi:phosphoserine phosphatase RsbU/P